ncbi:MAG TPA: hypothetical protein VG123_34165 [Streptosporangiaceae bacterium]|nr:hypothetical protein [Streptosporangiaceae bacterium]
MTFRALSSPLWRARAAAAAVLVIAAGVGYAIHASPPTYTESATVIFAAPHYLNTPRKYELYAPSLIASGATITQLMETPGARRAIRAAAGAGEYQIALVNLYNQDYPDYANPIATLTASATDPAVAHRTFLAAARLLVRLLAQGQAQNGVRPGRRIYAQVTGDTGTMSQAGSAKRVYGGLLLLALVAAGLARGLVLRRAGDGAARYGPARIRGHRARRPLMSRP